MQSLARLVLRPLALAVVAIAASLASAPVAHAQASQAVASPLTTKRLERLLKVYVSPTPEEATAIDRLHEAYLAKFRAELDPEIQAMGRSMGGGMPSQQEFEKFLRDLDRLQSKIAEADNAFLDSANDLLAESRRPGMQRIREARERQRNLSGFSRMGPMIFGGSGGNFVDLADVLAREEFVRQVPESSREQFESVLRTQEQRLLAQSRSYGSEIRKAFDSMYAIMSEAQVGAAGGNAGGDDPDAQAAAMQAQMENMQRMMQRMAELGKEANRIIGLNAEANRGAVRQFAAMLPELSYHRLRGEIARRSMGAMGMFVGGFSSAAPGPGGSDLAALLARLRRDREVTAEMRERFGPIELTWRRETADNLERTAELMGGLDMRAMMASGMNGGESEAVAAVRKVAEELREIDQRAYRSVREVIGPAKSEVVFSRQRTFSGSDPSTEMTEEILAPNLAALDAAEAVDAELADEPGSVVGASLLASAPSQWSAGQVARILKPLGVPASSLAVIEGVVEDWSTREWDEKVAPLGRELNEAVMARYRNMSSANVDPGEAQPLRLDPENEANLAAARRKVVDATFAADQVLFSEIGAALGFAPDSAETLLLRLERIGVATDGLSFGGGQRLVSPAAILARARISPDEARAFLERSAAEWAAFADSIDEAARAVIDRGEAMEKAMQSAQTSQDWQSYQKVTAANMIAGREFTKRYSALSDGAIAKANIAPEAATAIKRARLALARPDVYKRSESAMPQLDAALALDGITDDQRARLEALRAEYEAVYEMLSEKMSEGDQAVDPNDGEAWRTMQERMEAEEKLRFQRNERTEKARSEARRILGEELASRVRGLVPDDADAAASRQTNRFDPFAEEDD